MPHLEYTFDFFLGVVERSRFLLLLLLLLFLETLKEVV